MTSYYQPTHDTNFLMADMDAALAMITTANIVSFGNAYGYFQIEMSDGVNDFSMDLLGTGLEITGTAGNYVLSGTVTTAYLRMPGTALGDRSVELETFSLSLADLFSDAKALFSGTDYIGGGFGGSALYGYGGDDNMTGGPNGPGGPFQDTLYGGAGNDFFTVTEVADPADYNPALFGGSGRDTLFIDWNNRESTAVLDSSRFSATPVGLEVIEYSYAFYNYPDGFTYLNAKITARPGAGLLAAVGLEEIVDLQEITATEAGLIDLSGVAVNDSNDDVVDGSDSLFRYCGTEGDDGFIGPESFGVATDIAYFGYGGDDTLGGSASAIETLVGGGGDDSYLLGPSSFTFGARDVIVEAADGGMDVVASLSSTSLEDFANVENLILLGSDDINGTGNTASNRITGNGGDNILHGGFGGLDTLRGGAGDDTYYLTTGVTIIETAGAGIDTLIASTTATLATHVDDLKLTGSAAIDGMGNAIANRMTGNTGANLLTGAGGDDTLVGGAGADTLTGDAGQDRLTGGAGKDLLTGGLGDDGFDFNLETESATGAATADVIADFTRGRDKIDLAGIDAFAGGANNVFVFQGTAAFSNATKGEVRFKAFDQAGTANDHTMVFIDTDADTGVEMAIRLTGLYTLGASDFIL